MLVPSDDHPISDWMKGRTCCMLVSSTFKQTLLTRKRTRQMLRCARRRENCKQKMMHEISHNNSSRRREKRDYSIDNNQLRALDDKKVRDNERNEQVLPTVECDRVHRKPQ